MDKYICNHTLFTRESCVNDITFFHIRNFLESTIDHFNKCIASEAEDIVVTSAASTSVKCMGSKNEISFFSMIYYPTEYEFKLIGTYPPVLPPLLPPPLFPVSKVHSKEDVCATCCTKSGASKSHGRETEK